MRNPLLLQQLAATFVCLLLLASCADDIRYRGTCSVPETVAENQVVGTWQAEHHSFPSPDPQTATTGGGIERIQILSDGTYVQTFDSSSFTYASERNGWRLINEGDGPKLEMQGLRYFADGVEASERSLILHIQTPDKIRFQNRYESGPIDRTVKLTVQYPQDGIVYLYPRSCLGKFVLLQMVSEFVDPDDPAVHNPVFERLYSE